MCRKDLVETGKCRSEALEEGGNLWVATEEGADSCRQDRGSGDKQVGWEFTPPP